MDKSPDGAAITIPREHLSSGNLTYWTWPDSSSLIDPSKMVMFHRFQSYVTVCQRVNLSIFLWFSYGFPMDWYGWYPWLHDLVQKLSGEQTIRGADDRPHFKLAVQAAEATFNLRRAWLVAYRWRYPPVNCEKSLWKITIFWRVDQRTFYGPCSIATCNSLPEGKVHFSRVGFSHKDFEHGFSISISLRLDGF